MALLGDPAVGKTALLTKYLTGRFDPQTRPTLVIDVNRKTEYFQDIDATVKLVIWDTAGQERYDSMTLLSKCMRCLDAAIVVGSVDQIESMRHISVWRDRIKEMAPPSTIWYAVANKVDVDECSAQVDPQSVPARNLIEGTEIAHLSGIADFRCTSALTGDGVVDLFRSVARSLVTRQIAFAAHAAPDVIEFEEGEGEYEEDEGALTLDQRDLLRRVLEERRRSAFSLC